MFYQALQDGGVGEPRASIMYAGVLVGSGKWITRMRGKSCDLGGGVVCVNQTAEISLETKPESYGSVEFIATMSKINAQIQGGLVGQEAVEALAMEALPSDIFIRNPTGVIIENINVGAYATE